MSPASWKKRVAVPESQYYFKIKTWRIMWYIVMLTVIKCQQKQYNSVSYPQHEAQKDFTAAAAATYSL